MHLTVDPEFESFIPPLTQAEADALRASIQAEGRARDPIVVWGDTIVDGHNRYRICTELGLPFATVPKSFDSREAAKQWILDNQIGRRNLTPDQVIMLAAVRGIEPPPGFRGLAQCQLAAELVAADAPVDKVIAGKCTVRIAHLRWQESQGKRTRQRRKSSPADAAESPPPLDIARTSRKVAREARLEKRALAQALERIDVLESQLDLITAPASEALPPLPRVKFDTARRHGACVALLSDVHAGARVRRSTASYGNRYNPAIAAYRVRRWFTGVAWHVQAYRAVAWDLKDLVLWFGGDMIDGHLHGDQQETSQTAIATIDWLEPLLIDGIRQLQEQLDLEHLHLVCSYGNHGRDTVKPRRETGAEHSHEWGMYQRIARAVRGSGVQVLADPTAHQYCEIYGRTLHFTHGDEARYGGGVGGISIPLNKAFAQWDKVRRSDVHHCGHWHVSQTGPFNRWFANASVKGYDPFAMSVKGDPGPPQQTLYVFDAKRGPTAVTPLWVSDEKDEAEL